MCEGCSAELQMKQMILEDGVMEDRYIIVKYYSVMKIRRR